MAMHGVLGPSDEKKKREPTAHVSWAPEDGKIKMSGDHAAMGLGKKARVIVEGVVQGFRMDEWGCSIDLKPKVVRLENLGEPEGDEDTESFMSQVMKTQPKRKKHDSDYED